VREILERLSGDAGSRAGVAYRSFLDQEEIERRGMAPLAPSLARLKTLRSRQDYRHAAAIEARRGATLPLAFQVEPDDGGPEHYALFVAQDGLGMPDRDYYLSSSAQMREVRAAYRRYLAATLRLAGVADADRRAARVLALETRIAAASWTAAASRDVQRSYNPARIESLPAWRN
jgi:putative endopeptidase